MLEFQRRNILLRNPINGTIVAALTNSANTGKRMNTRPVSDFV